MVDTTGRDRNSSDAASEQTERNNLIQRLLDALWDRYRQRVPYVAAYEQMIAAAGATFVNDHIAFRTIARQRPMTGINTISRMFEALGYRAAGLYDFPDKHLSALHFRHACADFPKLFISELRSWELSDASQKIIAAALASHRPPLDDDVLARLHRAQLSDSDLIEQLTKQFHALPWGPPDRDAVTALNRETQYGAWVLVHGYDVNHFTALINSHGTPELDDIEKTAAALRDAGVPMKAEIEGERGSKLRQTTTEAVVVEVPVRDGRKSATMPWSYAYFEFAERGEVPDPTTGRPVRFDGFLGAQATQLFEMTRVASKS
ncbi:MAG: DUF1338 domain-containing protein [Planctomycetaceae bacterium]